MKRGYIIALISCVSLLVFSSSAFAIKLCPHRAVVIKHIYLDSTGKQIGDGEERFCNYCNEHCIRENYKMKMFGFGKAINEITYTTAENIRKIDMTTKPHKATIAPNPMAEFYKRPNSTEAWLKGMGAKKTEETCGKKINANGEVWRFAGGDFCFVRALGIVVGNTNQFSSKIPVEIITNRKVDCDPPTTVKFKTVKSKKASTATKAQTPEGMETPDMDAMKKQLEKFGLKGIKIPKSQ